MQSSNTPVIHGEEMMPSVTPSFVQALTRILALALPFAVGAAVTSALNLGKVAMLSRVPDTGALHVLSLMQPTFILVLAVMEGLAITNQVFSARSRHNWPRRGVMRASWWLSVIGIGIFSIVAVIVYGVATVVPVYDPVIRTTLNHFPTFVLSMTIFVVFDIFYGAMRGQGKVLRGLIPFSGLVLIDLGVTHLLVATYGWGFEAVLVGNLSGAALMLPVIVWMLRGETVHGEDVPDEAFRIRMRQLLVGVGIPVFSSIVVGFVSASVVFPVLSSLGDDNASAFFVVLRYRIAFMIPAIALGSAIAILVNQASEEGKGALRLKYLLIGVPVMLTLYGGVTALLPQWSGVLDLLVPSTSSDLRAATDFMFTQLLITFFLVAGSAMLQVILEQLGCGIQVLLITLLTEAGTCAAVIWAVQNGADLSVIVKILVGFAALAFVLFSIGFLMLLRKIGGGHPQKPRFWRIASSMGLSAILINALSLYFSKSHLLALHPNLRFLRVSR